jgi:hypothetical protein
MLVQVQRILQQEGVLGAFRRAVALVAPPIDRLTRSSLAWVQPKLVPGTELRALACEPFTSSTVLVEHNGRTLCFGDGVQHPRN